MAGTNLGVSGYYSSFIDMGPVFATAVSLTWALSLLLNNLDALKKVKDELDTPVGKDKEVEEPDMKNLVYLQAIIRKQRAYTLLDLSRCLMSLLKTAT
ncbi:hypothetical protein SLA2020_310220 [Shorea laevis]